MSGTGAAPRDPAVTARRALGWATQHLTAARVALDALEADRDDTLRQGLAPVPTDEGGPGHEETYWLRRKLDASIRHLRDIEDFYRLRGGTPESFNTVRADRARGLYEQISADFLNGKMTVPTMRERANAAEAQVAALREALAEALDLAEEGWGFEPDYYRHREDADATFARVRAALAATAGEGE